jgi:hypothetical protein
MPNELFAVAFDAEEALLGAILIESCRGTDQAIRKVGRILEPQDFTGCVPTDKPDRWPKNARIFYGMLNCSAPPHAINLANSMVNLGVFQIDDPALMRYCERIVPCSLDYMDYARCVKDYSDRRNPNRKPTNKLLGIVPL